MRQLRAVLFVALPLAACGGSGSGNTDAPVVIVPDAAPDAPAIDAPPDAPSYDFSCEGNAAPTTVATTVTISGTAQGVTLNGTSPSIDPLAAATIDFCKGDCTTTNKLDTKTSAADGTFTSSAIPTLTMPIDGYVKTTKATYRTSNVYPASPIVQDVTNVPAVTYSNTAFAMIAGIVVGGGGQSNAKGDLGLLVTDCSNTPIAGATLDIKQNGTAVTGTTVFDVSTLSPQAAGTFIVFNVPPGATEVGATYMGHTLRAHTVLVVGGSGSGGNAVPGQTTATLIRPGF